MIVRSHLIPFDPIHLISCWASGTCRWSRQLWQWHRLYPTGSSTSRHHVIHEFFQGGGRAEGWRHLSRYYGPDLYDINWLIPLHEATLEYDSVKLTLFIPSLDPRLRLEATQIKSNPIQISTASPHSTSRRSIRS